MAVGAHSEDKETNLVRVAVAATRVGLAEKPALDFNVGATKEQSLADTTKTHKKNHLRLLFITKLCLRQQFVSTGSNISQ